jgi:hypothetical protein
MKRFLWRSVGADIEILLNSGDDSKESFTKIGRLYLIVNCITYLSLFFLFLAIFENFIISILSSVVFGFLIMNIYLLNLISLEPRSLPVSIEIGSVVLANIIRYSSIFLFAIFISKSFEMLLFGFFKSIVFQNYSGSKGFIFQLFELNRDNPELWILTVIVVFLFIYPIYLRHRLQRTNEYYSIKQKKEIKLVRQEYLKFKEYHYKFMSNVYSKKKSKYFEPKLKFIDPPFNTKRIVNNERFKSVDDFLNEFKVI